MGALTFFCFMPGSKPPPWIMKPGMTRWKMTPSKKPSSTYSRKFFGGDRGFFLEQLDFEIAERGFKH